jgi:fermentation-respiration switch protein FrsA (DUF1100 family)
MNAALLLLGVVQITPAQNVVWHRPVLAVPGGADPAVTYGCYSRFGSLRSRRD